MLFATGIPREVAKFSMIRQREIMEYQNKKMVCKIIPTMTSPFDRKAFVIMYALVLRRTVLTY